MRKNVLLIGGYHKVMSLSQSLLKQGYHVTCINNSYEDCTNLASIEKLEIIYGDGTKPYVLEEAEAQVQDIAIALTPKDEDNLVICELCKKKYHIKKTVSLLRDPLKMSFFYEMGIDSVVCAISAITNIIEQQAIVDEITTVIPVENGRVNIIELKVTKGMPVINKTLANIKMPEESIIGYILRGENGIVPRGNTEILEGDTLLCICSNQSKRSVAKEITGK